MRVHLVDATYELFRAYHAPRPPVRGRDGMPLTAVAGLVGTLLALLRDEGATHVACAHDRVIRSFRNDLWPGYKTEAGVPTDLLAQFPVAEEAIVALGIPLWAMVELEADDALATAAARFAADPDVDAGPRLHARQGPRAGACAASASSCATGGATSSTTTPASGRSGASRPPRSPTGWPSWATPPTGSRGSRASGPVAASALLAAFDSLEGVRAAPPAGWPARVRGAERLAATLAEHWDDALLFRDLATLRLDAPLPERAAEELRWRGADRAAWEAFCARWELPGLRRRPHRWRDA